MTQWEYKVLAEPGYTKIQEALTAAGEEGWEAVNSSLTESGVGVTKWWWHVLMKRVVQRTKAKTAD